jgi:hypothetical protein
MKTAIALVLALVSTACGQLTAADLASFGNTNAKGNAKAKTVAVDVVIDTPVLAEPTARPSISIPSGSYRYGATTCDFDRRTCDDGSVLRFDTDGPIVCSPAGEITATGWAEWAQL